MDIEKTLSEGQSKSKTIKIIKYIGTDKARFKKLVDLFLRGDYRMTQRAAWPLGDIGVEKPELAAPYLKVFIQKLKEPGHHPAIARNILRILTDMEIPVKYHGSLVDICFGFITDARNPAAIRAFSLKVAANICKKYPELKQEFMLMLDEMKKYPQQPALASSLRYACRKLA